MQYDDPTRLWVPQCPAARAAVPKPGRVTVAFAAAASADELASAADGNRATAIAAALRARVAALSPSPDHRLQAVTCLYGFTRLEPAPTMSQALLEDVRLAVDGAPLAEAADWLPAMQQRGEGIFLKINSTAVRSWINRDGVRDRSALFERGWDRHAKRAGTAIERPGIP